jgi:hypothetical protein
MWAHMDWWKLIANALPEKLATSIFGVQEIKENLKDSLDPADEGSKCPKNVSNYLPVNMTLYPRILESS